MVMIGLILLIAFVDLIASEEPSRIVSSGCGTGYRDELAKSRNYVWRNQDTVLEVAPGGPGNDEEFWIAPL